MELDTFVVGFVGGGIGAFFTAYVKERITWGSRAQVDLVDTAVETLAATQEAKEAAALICKSNSADAVEELRDRLRVLSVKIAAARGKVIVYVGPKSQAAELSLGLSARLQQIADVSALERQEAISTGHHQDAEAAADSIGEHVDSLDYEVGEWGAAIHLAAEMPVWRRRWEALKQRRKVKQLTSK